MIKERAERKIQIRSRINPWSLVSREHKPMHEKLQLLRSITNSHALNDSSIVLDASKYIEELKQKVEILNQDLETAQTSIDQNPLPVATVETLEKGFLVNVSSDHKSCPGLLVTILEAFEELGLNVQQARVSCADNFLLQAVGENEEQAESNDVQVVKEAMVQAIKNWSGVCDLLQRLMRISFLEPGYTSAGTLHTS